MKTSFAGLMAAALMCAGASAQAELITWHAEGQLIDPKPYVYQQVPTSGGYGSGYSYYDSYGGSYGSYVPSTGSYETRAAVASRFANGQHFTMDYVIDNSVVGLNIPSSDPSYGSATAYAGALRSLNVRILESGLSYSMMPSQVRDGVIYAELNANGQLKSLDFTGNAGGNGLTLVSNTNEYDPVFYLISGHHPLPGPLAPTSPDSSLKDIGQALANAPSSTYKNSYVILGASQACHPVSAYCADATLSLSAFSVSAVPEPASLAMMGLGVAGLSVLGGLKRRGKPASLR